MTDENAIYQAFGDYVEGYEVFGTFDSIRKALECLDREMREELELNVKGWKIEQESIKKSKDPFYIEYKDFYSEPHGLWYSRYGIVKRIINKDEKEGSNIVYVVRTR